jgi:glycosyltransferase involved in cell wall biosynthesis
MNERNIFIIIPTGSIGGSEKRIIGFWLYALEHFPGKIRLILSADLFEKISKVEELKQIVNFRERIIFEQLDYMNIGAYTKTVNALIKKYVQRGDLLHFVSSYPYLAHPSNKTIFSFTESSLSNVNYKGRIAYYLSFLRAAHVDVLDPIVYNRLSRSVFFKNKISRTPNSFVDPALSLDIDFENKKNQVVQLGRFHKVKNIDKFISALPQVNNLLKQNGIDDAEFLILGTGALEQDFKQMLSDPAFDDIRYKIFFSENPQVELRKSKIILSIQSNNNYPSKSLLEGIMCGNIPLVTDVGTTREIAGEEFSVFLNENFTPGDLAGKILEIFQLDKKSFRSKAEAGINFVKLHYTIEKMAEYYFNLYNA